MSDNTPGAAAPDLEHVLNLELGPNDSGEPTVRAYLAHLLTNVWRHGEGFSGKCPFGNSSWEYDLYGPMVRAGLIEGEIDTDGYLDDFDQDGADALVFAAIKHMCGVAALAGE